MDMESGGEDNLEEPQGKKVTDELPRWRVGCAWVEAISSLGPILRLAS
jgi:hypothetical protein